MRTRRIIVTEEIEDLEPQPAYATQTDEEAINLLKSAMPPNQLIKLARRLSQAQASGGYITVSVEFGNGHAKRIVYGESERFTQD